MAAGRAPPPAQQGLLGPSQASVPDAIPGASQMGALPGMPTDTSNVNVPGISHSSAPSQTLDPAGGLGQMSPSTQVHIPQIAQTLSSSSLGMSAAAMLGGPNVPQPMTGPQSSASNPATPALAQEMNGLEHQQTEESRKRKSREVEEVDPKRVRQKTDASDTRSSVGLDRDSVPPSGLANGSTTPSGAHTARQPLRQRIEYVPLARQLDTAGGRNLEAIQHELSRAAMRPLKELNEWGQVDVEALAMSLRSRISTELSYGLTTFTMVTLLRFPNRETGFPISQALELLEEVLDLLEDVSFEGVVNGESDQAPDARVRTHRELVNAIVEDSASPFGSLLPKQGSRDHDCGPQSRPGEIILSILNILRNLSVVPENHEVLATHDRLLTIILRLCELAPSKPGDLLPRPASPQLSLQDLLALRKDVLHILVNIAGFVEFSSPTNPAEGELNARRAFELLSSFLTDKVESVTPFASMILSGLQPAMHQPRPPPLADITLEAFTRLFQPDESRRMLSEAVPEEWLWDFVESLVHRLPVSDNDFQVVMRDVWLGYVEKTIMAIYALAFLATPQLKKRIKTDRRLAFAKILTRLVKKFTIYSPQETRVYFIICVRRAIEALKMVDDAEDSFDTSQATSPTLMFGMGYGEHGESRDEKGMGLLSGYQDEITWGLMLQREVANDELVFSELESLVRVDRFTPVLSA
ncbi:uncharacterized protein FIBRA_02971 [Fibroporia radiculosa]|uniref:Uncharacterized protein n=1 Tax=Fibroporia radiculosa TaxID=599839 RepID=J4H253_9APHY|nr:uncharacterized protein FIBRA_02971 [Fibroporia radiculosa]CCM00924.1 predicted protein [Fibroporia radiculosa]